MNELRCRVAASVLATVLCCTSGAADPSSQAGAARERKGLTIRHYVEGTAPFYDLSTTLMWPFAFTAQGSESDWWRLPVIVCIAGIEYFAFKVRGFVDARGGLLT